MKKLFLLILLAIGFACSNDRQKDATEKTEANNEVVEESSGENISPQLEDSVDRFKVDSISSAAEANEQKKNELEDGKSSGQ
jgi:hypothetical protein